MASKQARSDEKIAIVGGGITGLYCAYVLAQQKKSVWLFEASDRLGGRIKTVRLTSRGGSLKPLSGSRWKVGELEFCAEFGPMRIELDKQLLVKALLDLLAITEKADHAGNETDKGSTDKTPNDGPYLKSFPPYASPSASTDPKYDLRPSERDKTPLELLRLAMLRIVGDLEVTPGSSFDKQRTALISKITVASATGSPVEPIFMEWMKKLSGEHYWEIQEHGSINGVPLHAMGFWNLLSDYLSHDALTMLRDLGTFYHLIPENPNAAEWLVWWLLGFSISKHLQGVHGGMQCIVDRLEVKLRKLRIDEKNKRLFKNAVVTDLNVAGTGGKIGLGFERGGKPTALTELPKFDRVIMALPKAAAERLVRASKPAFESERQIAGLLDSAFAFPMVKAFVAVKDRWWEEANRANRYATRVPTRELHYWKGVASESRRGLIMIYTDRPASSFWSNYVPPGSQTDVHEKVGNPLPKAFAERLVRKVVQYVNENQVPDVSADDVEWYGIRDWAREPFGGANHAWRPERKYWIVMRRLADIASANGTRASIHVCGEAYSDYHGFIEGSLRSATYVLHRILSGSVGGTNLGWLADSGLNVEANYFASLQVWVQSLDDTAKEALTGSESYLFTGKS
jgi:hypothetical protein